MWHISVILIYVSALRYLIICCGCARTRPPLPTVSINSALHCCPPKPPSIQAIAATGRIVKSSPGHLEALTLRGEAYMYLADHDMAKRHFGEALKFDPDHVASRRAFNKLKDLDRKRQRANRCVRVPWGFRSNRQWASKCACLVMGRYHTSGFVDGRVCTCDSGGWWVLVGERGGCGSGQ